MIKINLTSPGAGGSASVGTAAGISSEGFLAPDEARQEALKRIIIMFIPALALYAYQEHNIPQMQRELGTKTQMVNELTTYNAKQSASVAEIKKFKEDEALIEARIAALDKIAKDRHLEIRVLDLLQQVIPEKAWITQIKISPGRVAIQGMALSDFEVSSFLEALTKSVFLMDVNLVSSSEAIIEGVSLKKFEISCLLEKPMEKVQ